MSGGFTKLGYKIELLDGQAVLPQGGDLWHFCEWNDAADKIRLYKEHAVGHRLNAHESHPVELALVHRPDNEYNKYAISISAPTHYGGDREQRFFGYFYDYQLKSIGMTRLADLAETTNGAIRCTGIATQQGLVIDLAKPKALAHAIDVFLGYEATKTHTNPSSVTEKAYDSLIAFDAEQFEIDGLHLETFFGRDGRRVILRDKSTRRLVGYLDKRFLVLEDERERENVLKLLSRLDVPVRRPISEGRVDLKADWPLSRAPNLQMDITAEVYQFPPVVPIARYNPKTRKLWVEDSRLVGPSLCYAARVGLEVVEVGVPRKPWRLDDEVPFDVLRNYGRRNEVRRKQEKKVEHTIRSIYDKACEATLQRLITKDMLHAKSFQIMHGLLLESKHEAIFNESFVKTRSNLFGALILTHKLDKCRLCGRMAAKFKASICVEELAYCHKCLEFASTGLFENRPRAVEALKLIAELEFNDEPMLEGQLESLHLNPEISVTAEFIDRLLLLRFLVKRQKFPWTLLLEAAGFAKDGLRLSRGTLMRARDGHLCFSMREKAICDFLHQFGVEHEREPLYPLDELLNPLQRRRGDWRLADGTFVEFWGLPNDPTYAVKMREKRELARKHGLPLIEITDPDLPRLPLVFAPWLRVATPGATSWVWSPMVEPVKENTKQKSSDGHGRNATNAAARRDRIDRCRRALELQLNGSSRRDISTVLGVSQDGVKLLLRDAKFFENPASNERRLQRALAADSAQKRGLTKAQYKEESGFDDPQVNQSWKDADALNLSEILGRGQTKREE
ncbi:hypothetical protein ACX5I6_19590 [Arthrobacter sp. MMS24-T111]